MNSEPPALLVGAPVRGREWVIDEWISYLEESAWNAGVEPGYVIVGAEDDPTVVKIYEHCVANQRFFQLVTIKEKFKFEQPGRRTWHSERYHHMVDIRNRLLTAVRLYHPGAFLSLDSDILLHKDTLGQLSESLTEYDAVGGKLYLGHVGRSVPNHAFLRSGGGQTYRTDHEGGVVKTDVLMACKLMSSQAYHIDYEHDHRGEDFGWSKAAKDEGLRLGWDARTCNKHIMKPEDLNKVDKRCGY